MHNTRAIPICAHFSPVVDWLGLLSAFSRVDRPAVLNLCLGLPSIPLSWAANIWDGNDWIGRPTPTQDSGVRLIQDVACGRYYCRRTLRPLSLSLDISYALPICFRIMETLELLLTILIGILIGNFVVNHEWKKPRPRGASTAPPTTPPATESPITAQPTTEAYVTKTPKRPFVVRVSGIRPNDHDEHRVKSLVKAIAGLSDSENGCVGQITVVPSCTDTDNLVAIVDFKVLPDIFSSLKKGFSKVCEVPGQNDYYLDFDAVFVGFTQMYSTETKPTVE